MTASASRWTDSITANAHVVSRIAVPSDVASHHWKNGRRFMKFLVFSRDSKCVHHNGHRGHKGKMVATQCGWSFLALLFRRAARDRDDDTRLWTIAVEPVVGNHAPEDDDAGPENQRESAGQTCPLW